MEESRELKKIELLLIVSFIVSVFLFSLRGLYAFASHTGQNVSGFAWSENVGWISFNHSSGGGSIDYGVTVNMTSGEFSGYAWSENVGWISFNRADTGAPPAAPYNGGESYLAKLNTATSQVTGWARALAQGEGWDGWIKFAGAAQDGSPYGVTIDSGTGDFSGWAWGGDVIGWISFNCANTSCATTNYKVQIPPLTSNIDATNRYAYSERGGWIDFNQGVNGVVVTATQLTGYAYGDRIGWINMQPTNGGVINDGNGNLSGYAYGDRAGWISFDPDPPGADTERVTIDSNGFFHGYAYGDRIGWFSFNCANTNSCGAINYKVQSSWNSTQFVSNIDLVNKYAYSETYGWVDFRPASGGVRVDADKLIGYAFAEGFGWISMNCNQTAFDGTNTCATVNYGITNANGNLAGYAWSETLGFISFNCNQTSTGGGNACGPLNGGPPTGIDYWVKINTASGDFYGYAYGEGVGYIRFNCDQTNYTGSGGGIQNCAAQGGQDYKVNTTWAGVPTPTNIQHTANTPTSITWSWDNIPNHTYQTQLYDGTAFYNTMPFSAATNVTTVTAYTINGTDPVSLTADRRYTIRVRAVDASLNVGNYTTQASEPASQAATSANAPTTLFGAPVAGSNGTEMDWSWSSGGMQTGFYARLQEMPTNTSGWQAATTWRATGLSCNTSYTLQVLAKNQDRDACFGNNSCTVVGAPCAQCTGDETAWQTVQVTSGACPTGCTDVIACNPGDLPDGNICVEETPGNKSCKTSIACTPQNVWCNDWATPASGPRQATIGKCVAGNTCDTKPFAAITIVTNGTAGTPSQFHASTARDDTTAPADLLARWDFDYQVGQPGEPNWSAPSNFDYPSGKKATNTVNYQYPSAGSYTVAVQVRDSAQQDSDIFPLVIIIGGGTIALNPDRSPTTNPANMYNFGVVPPNKTVDIVVTICNIGIADLTLTNYYFELPFGPVTGVFSLTDATGAGNFTKPLVLADDSPQPTVCDASVSPFSRQGARIRFSSPSANGAYGVDLVIQSTDTAIPSPGKRLLLTGIVQSSPVGETGSETVNFDVRVIANPPPVFVEFLDQFKFKEEEKTR